MSVKRSGIGYLQQLPKILTVPVLLLALWYILYALEVFHRAVFPPFHLVLKALWELTITGEIFVHIGASLLRVLMGYLLAMALAIPLGLVCGWFKKAHDFIDLTINAVRSMPVVAWIPMAILWFGMGQAACVFIIVIAVFFPTLLNTMAGVRQVDKNLISAAINLGVKPDSWCLFKEIILPSALPMIMTGMKLSLGYAWAAIVAAEMISQKSGVGYLLMWGKVSIRTEVVFAGMFLIMLCGLFIDRPVKALEKHLLRWQPDMSR